MKIKKFKSMLILAFAVGMTSCKDQKAEDAKLKRTIDILVSIKVKNALNSAVKEEVKKQLQYASKEEMRRIAQHEAEQALKDDAEYRTSQNEALINHMAGY